MFPPDSVPDFSFLVFFFIGRSAIGFGYSRKNGPDKWGNLDPTFSACSSGKNQSPISIQKNLTVHNKLLKPLTRNYIPANSTLVNNGFNVGVGCYNLRLNANKFAGLMNFLLQVHFEENAGEVSIDGKNYSLRQMHWHLPSEHQIDGEQYALSLNSLSWALSPHPTPKNEGPNSWTNLISFNNCFAAELHLVHRAADNSIAVVAILYQEKDADPLISKVNFLSSISLVSYFSGNITYFMTNLKPKRDSELKQEKMGNMDGLNNLAKEKSKADKIAEVPLGTLDTEQLMRSCRKYYRYVGSLTTPPCSENVIWSILGKVRSISKEQMVALETPVNSNCKKNARPCQPLNGRKIELYDELIG
ncbi:alpha carbonic anhydrase 1, chloroplastic-like [Durio zibethinus]|uniref:Alpha carbonic anhydrase 1, chloroplastic-like n=1 Tax=Durio zibethinus TaxID=66656 RepID=A0A6P6ALR9_DURZI|nr:alpha carbonic anhydrase 1, chloroplastic-like [Durio zibethinus]